VLVHELLEHTAECWPDRTALVAGIRRTSYAELNNLSDRLASGLGRCGVRRGDRVVVLLDNCTETVVSIFGALKAGAAFTVLNPSTKSHKLAGILRDEQPVVLITTCAGPAAAAVAELPQDARPPTVITVGDPSWAALLAGPAVPRPANSPDDLGCIIWTSGTSGTPKGVMSLHRDMTFAATAIAAYLENTADDVIFCALSLGFTYGLYQLLSCVSVGATLVLENGFAFPHHALDVMQRERVTGLPGVPTMFSLLLGLQGLSRYDLTSLRYLTNAAAPMPVEQVLSVERLFPQARFFSMYGQTECKRICYLPPEELAARPGSVGRAIPGTVAVVVDADGRVLPAGEIGELVVRGPHLMSGYWNAPDATAQRLRPGPAAGEVTLHTGDLFRTDDEGFLYFVSRADDIIKSRGEKVSPAEIEDVLRGLPGVVDVAAVGVPDPLLGEAVKAYVVIEDGSALTAREVRAFCARRLEDFMVPSQVEFCAELPKSENGKTLRRKLRTCAA
jgi:long-chain acyl-CoA synthetase